MDLTKKVKKFLPMRKMMKMIMKKMGMKNKKMIWKEKVKKTALVVAMIFVLGTVGSVWAEGASAKEYKIGCTGIFGLV